MQETSNKIPTASVYIIENSQNTLSVYRISFSMFYFFMIIAMAIPATWWWVQRPMQNRCVAYGVSFALLALGGCLLFSLRDLCPALGLSGYILSFMTFFFIVVMLFSEGVNMPECRRRTIEAALPTRLVDCITLPCCISDEQMVTGFRRYMIAITCNPDGSLDGAYEDAYRDWSCRLCDYLRNRELAAICKQHRLPIEGSSAIIVE